MEDVKTKPWKLYVGDDIYNLGVCTYLNPHFGGLAHFIKNTYSFGTGWLFLSKDKKE
jgi:hypothetical protein